MPPTAFSSALPKKVTLIRFVASKRMLLYGREFGTAEGESEDYGK